MVCKIHTISDQYPGLYAILSEKRTNPQNGHFFLVKSPFGNCQSFCINNVQKALELPVGDFKKIMSKIYKEFSRRIVVIDVKEEYSLKVLEMFGDVVKNIVSTPYVSSNASKMIMHIITLNTEVLLKQ